MNHEAHDFIPSFEQKLILYRNEWLLLLVPLFIFSSFLFIFLELFIDRDFKEEALMCTTSLSMDNSIPAVFAEVSL